MAESTTILINGALAKLRSGDPEARKLVLTYAHDRLRERSHWLLNRSPGLRRFADTDDVANDAALDLWTALEKFHPENARVFFALCGKKIRFRLLDLADKYRTEIKVRPTNPVDSTGGFDPADSHTGTECERREEILNAVSKLSEDQQELFDLIFVLELPFAEIADLRGVSTKTIQREWRDIKLKLAGLMPDNTYAVQLDRPGNPNASVSTLG